LYQNIPKIFLHCPILTRDTRGINKGIIISKRSKYVRWGIKMKGYRREIKREGGKEFKTGR